MSLALAAEEITSVALSRPAFSALHLLQANQMGAITEAHRAGRPSMHTIPIDDIDAHQVADRDDGIFVETQRRENGGYRVHITIADVAGLVPLNNSLAQAALARGFTVYGPGWTDPMFPKALEEKLSLEHHQERLGFTVSIDLNSEFRPLHTEFKPVITRAESMSYAQASEHMNTDPQLQQMAQIALGIRRYYFGHEESGKLLQDGFWGRNFYVSPSSSGHDAMEMVATYMLLTNSCMAEFFNRSELPYLYRNFDSESHNAYARYHTQNDGHDALRRDRGLESAYGHFTSPIRRAVDLLNLYMAHFAFDALQSIEDGIIERFPYIDHVAVHKTVWRYGPQILRAGGNKTNDQERKPYGNDAENSVFNLLRDKFELDEDGLRQVAIIIVTKIQQLSPSLSSGELEKHAGRLNALMRVPETRAVAKMSEDFTKLESLDKSVLPTMEKKAFTSYLRCAAVLGEIPRSLYNEALKRIEGSPQDNTHDIFIILILASNPNIPRWNMLKRAALRRIKHNPGAVNAIIEQCRDFFGKEELQERSTNLSDHPDTTLPDRDKANIFATILTLRQKSYNSFVASPFYSVGHNARAAKSHARYAFLEHFAFGELQPVEQTSLPNVLYAELEGEEPRRALVEEMVFQAGGKLKYQRNIINGCVHIRLEASGGRFITPIVIEAEDERTEAAEHVAFRRLLRSPKFKHTVAPVLQVGAITDPQYVLKDIAQEKGYSLVFSSASPLPSGGFSVQITVTSKEATKKYVGTGPNKDRALRAATVVALSALGKTLSEENSSFAHSWVTDNNEAHSPHFFKKLFSKRPPKQGPPAPL